MVDHTIERGISESRAAAAAPPYWSGFVTQPREISSQRIAVQGRMPAWLQGTLVRTGPAQFEVGSARYRHWFDGLAMLHRFAFHGDHVEYANAFVRSRSYEEARQSGRISRGEFATDPCLSLFGRLRTLFSPKVTDNPNVNVSRLADAYVALTEVPLPIAFDKETLDTLGPLPYDESLGGQMSTAHPHYDFAGGRAYNYQARLGRKSQYLIFGTSASAPRGALVATVDVDKPAYMHSFGMTERYVVLVEFPLVVTPLRLMFSGLTATPFIENYRWRPERGTRFTIVDKSDGRVVRRVQTEGCFVFHHVNAYEQGNEVVVDMVAYADDAIVRSLYLDKLREGYELPPASLRRYRISLTTGSVAEETLTDEMLELPRINYRANSTRPYRYVFGAGVHTPGNFIDQLSKFDLQDGSLRNWFADGCYPGEPVFVPAPESGGEDQGVVLSVVLDARANRSFLLVLDGVSFEELARAEVPQTIPFGFHGQFFGG